MCENKRLKTKDLIEGVDFNWEVIDGIKFRVFTKDYLSMIRPICCKNGCRNCPWDYKTT